MDYMKNKCYGSVQGSPEEHREKEKEWGGVSWVREAGGKKQKHAEAESK